MVWLQLTPYLIALNFDYDLAFKRLNPSMMRSREAAIAVAIRRLLHSANCRHDYPSLSDPWIVVCLSSCDTSYIVFYPISNRANFRPARIETRTLATRSRCVLAGICVRDLHNRRLCTRKLDAHSYTPRMIFSPLDDNSEILHNSYSLNHSDSLSKIDIVLFLCIERRNLNE